MALNCRCCLFAANVLVFILVFNRSAIGSEVNASKLLIEPTKLWRFLGRDEETILQKYSENIEEFSVERIKCLRYCIQSKSPLHETPHFLHLIWKLEKDNQLDKDASLNANKDFTPKMLPEKLMIEADGSSNLQNQCTFSIVIGCEIPQELEENFSEVEKTFIKTLQPNLNIFEKSADGDSSALKSNFVNEKVVDKSNLMNATIISFPIKKNQTEMNAIIMGNISKIDLKMPIGGDIASVGKASTPQLTLASTRTIDGSRGLKLNVINPPPGGWRLGLKGENGEPYRLIVDSKPGFTKLERSLDFEDDAVSSLENTNFQENVRKIAGISSRQIQIADASDDMEVNAEFTESLLSNRNKFDDQAKQRSFKFPLIKNDAEIFNSNANISMRMDTNQMENELIDRKSSELDDLNRSINNELPITKLLILDIDPSTNLIATPGTIQRVIFLITNNHVLRVRHFLQPKSSIFRVIAIQPFSRFIDIAPGQTGKVIVDIEIPTNIAESVVNTVTLQVQGIDNLEKSANIYVQTSGSKPSDDVKPTIYYNFNNNCAGRTSAEKCLKSYWSVDITIQDSETGLKSITSVPKGAYPRTQYVSGTTSPVYFYYSNNCCNRIVEVTASDVVGNTYSKRIDVEEWNNLMEGEIAAVVIGVLFLILLIIVIVLTIIYCCNRRKSHDLSYSQRYGSRSAPSSG